MYHDALCTVAGVWKFPYSSTIAARKSCASPMASAWASRSRNTCFRTQVKARRMKAEMQRFFRPLPTPQRPTGILGARSSSQVHDRLKKWTLTRARKLVRP